MLELPALFLPIPDDTSNQILAHICRSCRSRDRVIWKVSARMGVTGSESIGRLGDSSGVDSGANALLRTYDLSSNRIGLLELDHC